MRYIADMLGIEVNTKPWDGANKLPYFLIDRYDFKKATLDGVPCLFIMPKGEPDTLTAIKKHIARVREVEPLPVVLELDGMTARRRKSLIEARIPFAASGCQIYLPFLGIALNERYTTMKAPGETLMPSSQLLLFHYLYQDEPELRTGGAADMFGLSAMQISRAIKQLTALGLVTAHKDGVRMLISGTDSHRALFEKAKPHLLNPVRKRMYAERGELPDGLPLASCSALSELSMLGGPATTTFAFFGKVGDITGTDALVDGTVQAEVEMWRYNPMLLSKRPGIVDTLSLFVSLPPDDDPRVEQAIEKLLSDLWGEKDG